MSILDCLLENMTVRTRGATTERLSFLGSTMDESSKKMISKSLSKIGKSKETLQKEKEQGLKAMYKLSLLINKKLRAIRFNFFVKLEEHCKQITNQTKQIKYDMPSVINPQQCPQPISSNMIQIKPKPSTKQLLDNMCQLLDLHWQKQYSYNLVQNSFEQIHKYSVKMSSIQQGLDNMCNIVKNYQNNCQMIAFDQLKLKVKQIEKVELFSAIITSYFIKDNIQNLQNAFYQIKDYSEFIKQQSQSIKSKQLTQQSSTVSLRLSPKVNKYSKHLQFKFYKNDVEQVRQNKSFKFVPSFYKDLKSPSISRIEPCLEINDSSSSNIFIEKFNKQNRMKYPLKIQLSDNINVFPKFEERILFFQNPTQNIPKQLHKLYPDKVNDEIHDTTQPFGLFDKIDNKQPFAQTNKDLSRARSQHKLKPKNSQKIIKLKNSFIETSRGESYFCTPKRESKFIFCGQPRPSIGLKSSRRIKESCVGQQWERLDIDKFLKTQSFSPSKEAASKILSVSTSRPRCMNSISIVKAELFSRQKHDIYKQDNHTKKICSQFLNRIGKI